MSAPVAAAAHAGARERDKTADRDASRQAVDRAQALAREFSETVSAPWAGHIVPTEMTLSSSPVIDYGLLGNVIYTPASTTSNYYNAAELTGPHHPHAG